MKKDMKRPKRLQPEWARVGDVCTMLGLGKLHLMEAIKAGHIEARHVKHPDAARGLWMVSLDSARAYVKNMQSAQEVAA